LFHAAKLQQFFNFPSISEEKVEKLQSSSLSATIAHFTYMASDGQPWHVSQQPSYKPSSQQW
jgi:hypothetical protein